MIAILAIMDTAGTSVYIALITALNHLAVVKEWAPDFVAIDSFKVTGHQTLQYMEQLEMVRT